ncbi:AAA family ATPase [Planktothrix serta]|uniref:AAA family ATPase n=1 Tax=Planktothrix serta TaxID=1678310 RepID=UPI0012DE1BB2|nr:ATP-binding protein [Planktothrix serta]
MINQDYIIGSIISLICWALGALILILRPLEWALSSIFNLLLYSNKLKGIYFIKVTPIPIINLAKKIKKWLLHDWETGLHNANQLLEYTLQYESVVQGISHALSELPQEHIIFRTSQLTNYPYDWTVIQLIFKKLNHLAEQNNVNKNILIQDTLNNYLVASNATKGFWYLHESAVVGDNGISLEINFIEESVKAFTQIRSLPYGEELYILAQTLAAFANAGELAVVTLLRLPAIPQEPILRTSTWEVINSLHQVVQVFREIQSKVSYAVRLSALKRALIELDSVQGKVDLLPEAERFLIKYIVSTWQDSLKRVNTQLEKFSINAPVENPYIIGDPVQGRSFVKRQDILKKIEEVWVSNKQLQSIVLYGHRRMGKTSILQNVSTCLDEKVKLAYVNLLTVGNSIQGVGEVLMAIADSLSDTLQIPPPDDESLINLPYRTFERYLKQIETQLGDTGLIIALDEFEQIEELIKSDRIPKDFMGVLRGMVQMSPKIAFALAGLHTLEEMTEDYFNPFFASIIPIRVSFLERATCRYLLANPSEDFPLDYKPDALDYIYDLTAGQPYLVQLIGFLLVRRYNDQVFELGNNRDPMFTIADVDGIINQPEFYQNGRYYFTGVWQQAGEGSLGQQNIIKAIAPHPTGLDFNTLQTVTNLDSNSLQNALDTLSRHDVIIETDNHWRIIVELFRRWVINSVKLNLLT